MSTGHANSPGDMLSRLETMVLMGMDLPLTAVRRQIASGVDLIVHLGRLRDGSRKVLEIVELDAIKCLVDQGFVTIAAGGGGIPVIRENGQLQGTAAVIDKDFASEKLAEAVDADQLLILTGVDQVCVNYNKPDQKGLDRLSVAQARQYMAEGQFAPGSMLPKVEAAVRFAASKPGRETLITSLEKAVDALQGKTGTVVYA